jgi:predicted methyltransferase
MFPHVRTWSIWLSSTLLLAAAAAAAAAVGAAPKVSTEDTAMQLQKAVDGDWRSAEHRERDRYRHPVQTLQFFGIQTNMTVIELAPGGGWYTEILAPFLAANGHLIEAASPNIEQRIKDNPVFGHIVKIIPFKPPLNVALGAPHSANMVLTFRSTHDWLNDSPATLDAVFKAVFEVLKPGGTFGVVEHRAKPFADAVESSKQLHRIPEDYLIALGLKTGFRLQGVSEINANPQDSESVNVHRLLPDLVGPESEHAEMKAIGESDRMTLRFQKP